jgi:hypothetical protein
MMKNRSEKRGRHDRLSRKISRLPAASRERSGMPLLRGDVSLLLALPLRVPDLSSVHAGEFLGHVV